MTRGIWSDAELLEYREETEELVGGFFCTIRREPADPEDEPTIVYDGIPCFYLPSRTREVFQQGAMRQVREPAQIWLAYSDLTSGIEEDDFVSRVVDQLDTVRIDRAHNIQGLERHDSHVVVELAGVRS